MTIGGNLAKARQDAGLTIGQVSRKTRIRETVITAIERDDYGQCGGNFYVRGHIRSIGRCVGIDPEPLVRDYDDAHGGAPQTLPAPTAFRPETPVRFRERRSPNWSAAMAIAVVLVVGYGVFRLVTGGDSHRLVPQSARPPMAQPTTPSASPSPSPSHADAGARRPRTKVTVGVEAERASYIKVRNKKGTVLFHGILHAGRHEEWIAKKHISLVIGNGGAVVLTVNGEKVGVPGKDGHRLRIGFGRNDPHEEHGRQASPKRHSSPKHDSPKHDSSKTGASPKRHTD